MKLQTGVTLLELVVAIAIMAVLASLSMAGYESSIQNANLRIMREAASKLALSQQQHRQAYGRYASAVKAQGNPTSTTLTFSDLERYNVTIANADFREFTATLSPKSTSLKTKPRCTSLRVSSNQGYLSFSTLSNNGQNSTAECLPNG